MEDPYLGELMLCPYNFAPVGWMDCAGQLLPVSQYAALFSLLGTNFGGDGKANFALPNLQGRVALGAGTDASGNTYTLGQAGGVETVALTLATTPSHGHSLNANAGISNTTSPTDNTLSKATEFTASKGGAYRPGPGTTTLLPATVAMTGGNAPHNNLQPYMALRYAIAVSGEFPTRP